MSDVFFNQPILNSPYKYPGRHWKLDERGQPTQAIEESRRTVDKASGIPKPTATRILRVLREEDILQVWQKPRGRKPAVYAYGELLNVAEGYKVF